MLSNPKKPVIDFHVHLFPYALDPLLEKISSYGPTALSPSRKRVDQTRSRLRKQGRRLFKPFSESFHRLQPFARLFPPLFRKGLDRIGDAASLPGFLVESTPSDLDSIMEECGVHRALAIASPPLSDNEFILRECVKNPKLIPVVTIPTCEDPAARLRGYVERGAKALKILLPHSVNEADTGKYLSLLQEAEQLKTPVILHTGYESGRIERASSWFELYPKIHFVLAHMNFHEPLMALQLADSFKNVLVDTSWQPVDVIGEAVRRMGADRVLFASDWPQGGRNMEVGLRRIEDCVEMGLIRPEEAQQVLGLNAARLLYETP